NVENEIPEFNESKENKLDQIETNDKYNEEIYKDDADSIIQSTEDSKEQDDNYKDTQVNTGATDLQKKGNDSKGRKKSGDDFRANKSSEIVYEKTSKLGHISNGAVIYEEIGVESSSFSSDDYLNAVYYIDRKSTRLNSSHVS